MKKIICFCFIFNNIAHAESPCSSQVTESTFYLTNDNINIPCLEVPIGNGSLVAYQAYLKKVPNKDNELLFSLTNVLPVDNNSPKTTSKPNIANTDLCQDFADTYPTTKGSTPPGSKWLYQLQAASIPFINKSNFDILTLDYSRDGTDNQRYSNAEIDSLHANNKVVLAYLSIGEAEEYRYYFDNQWVAKNAKSTTSQPTTKAPCWLGLTNEEWHGNYKTQYWSETWQQILIGYLDKVIDAGYDGVYLDITDAYYYWSNPNNGEKLDNGQNLVLDMFRIAQRMINLVKRIAYHARVVRGKTNFYIFPQNGAPILEFDTDNSYLETISGIGVEDLFYNEIEPVSDDETWYRLEFIMKIKQAGKKVLLVDYLDDGSGYQGENKTRIDDFREKAQDEGFIPYVGISDRALDTLHIIKGIQE
ncbi:MJ1477/TM1410 family putative glycoside hydrolase [Candidatus Marithrix sp. Canyon 246]|uniref:MJ1477/TM1410 family putative glycoside hydrolase n=1 Tax=Candidatus Marithrix sp. Canyon 246 TaxID=1827136 RepID=UPI00084A12BD|nr:MJ1477/TM1410 family putative glycoside hydrolase [Candidatus Marithrix sp. Canyon 246]